LSESVVRAAINMFPAIGAIPVLQNGRTIWGILEAIEPAGEGMIQISVSGQERLVDEALQETLSLLHGKGVAVCHLDHRWGAGSLA
jgi:hypothetical protein